MHSSSTSTIKVLLVVIQIKYKVCAFTIRYLWKLSTYLYAAVSNIIIRSNQSLIWINPKMSIVGWRFCKVRSPVMCSYDEMCAVLDPFYCNNCGVLFSVILFMSIDEQYCCGVSHRLFSFVASFSPTYCFYLLFHILFYVLISGWNEYSSTHRVLFWQVYLMCRNRVNCDPSCFTQISQMS